MLGSSARSLLLPLPPPAAAAWRRASNSSSSSSSNSSAPPFVYEDDQLPAALTQHRALPSVVWDCLHALRSAGHEVLLVGGAVRDLLLQQHPKDFDLLTSAQLSQVKELFRAHRPRLIGRRFPICQFEAGPVKIEVSSWHTRPPSQPQPPSTAAAAAAAAAVPPDVAEHLLRAGAAPGRGRRCGILPAASTQQPGPSSSWAVARRLNAAARDFTANGLLYDPFQRLLFDYVGGMADLRGRRLRCIGQPGSSFQADPARLLRAVRCAARADLSLEPATAAALLQHGHLAAALNPQRLTAELAALLVQGAAAASLQLLQETGLMRHVLPLHHQHMQAAATGHGGAAAASSSSHERTTRPQQQHQQAQHHQQPQVGASAAGGAVAGSALGQLVQQLQPHRAQQQRQQQTTPMLQQNQQHGQQCALLRVAAALDQQLRTWPAAVPPEVLLACLTAPLLLDALHAAVQQLQHVEQQQQWQDQREQQQPRGLHLQQFAAEMLQQLKLQQQQQHRSHIDSGAPDAAGVAQPVAVAAAVRLFSSTAAGEAGAGTGPASSPAAPAQEQPQHSRRGWLASQLLQGVAIDDAVQQQAQQLASQVCAGPSGMAASNQHSLFGVHAPQLATDLLMASWRLCGQPRQQQLPHADDAAAAAAGGSWDSSSSSSSSRSRSGGLPSNPSGIGRRRLASSVAEAPEAHEPEPFPRTNKQFKALMRKHTLQQAVGCLAAVPSPEQMLLAAAIASTGDEGEDGDRASRGMAGGRKQQQQQQHAVSPGLLVHRVLTCAGAGFDGLQLAGLQAQALVNTVCTGKQKGCR